jgi:putative salt-induced outer membrane protein YdiY
MTHIVVTLFALALCMPPSVRAAGGIILNTLQGLDDHEPGWSGSVSGLYSASGGNTERLILAASGRVQWRGERNRWQFRSAFGYEESGGNRTANNATTHLRHNYDITDVFATVAFVQVQENEFQRIESRWLAGLGMRADVLDNDRTTFIVGATPMYELQRIEDVAGRSEHWRLSTFIIAERRLNDTFRTDFSGFYQPRFSDTADYRTVLTLTFVAEITDRLDMKLGATTETNSRPAAGVEKTDWTTFASLTVTL